MIIDSIIDSTTDTSLAQLHRIGQQYRVPDYVSKAVAITEKTASSLPREVFALPMQRRYPIDTAANTWLSAAYMAVAPPQGLNEIETKYACDRMILAAQIHGIVDDVAAVLAPAPAQTKTASAEAKVYGAIIKVAGAEEKHFPLNSVGQVVAAIQVFDKYAAAYPGPIRKQIAQAIVKQAQCLGVGISDRAVLQETGDGFPDPAIVLAQLEARADIVKAADIGIDPAPQIPATYYNGYAELLPVLRKMSAQEWVKHAQALAEQVSMLDDSYGLRPGYGKTLLRPAQFFHAVPVKVAEEAVAAAADVIALGGYNFSLSKMAAASPILYVPVLGMAQVTALLDDNGNMSQTKLAAFLSQLNEDSAAAIGEALAHA